MQLLLDMRHQLHRQRIPQVLIIVYQLGQLVMRPVRRKRHTLLALIILFPRVAQDMPHLPRKLLMRQAQIMQQPQDTRQIILR